MADYLGAFMNRISLLLKKNIGTITVLSLMLLVRSTFANQYLVPTGSMIPTIAIGDRIYTNRVAYDLKLPFSNIVLKSLGEPKHGDVVVFESPKEKGLVLVKRLIALPGDQVRITNGFVELNGKRLDDYDGRSLVYREFLYGHRYSIQRDENSKPEKISFTVPENHYFMMGDNRDHSADGRYFGFVERSLLIGRADRVLFSMDLPSVKLERFGKKLD
jgi:signal peptidase I